jgi:hypothetical protein
MLENNNPEESLNPTPQEVEAKRERWEELYDKYSDAVKNPTNIYRSQSE